jgi:hypothetical protein
MSKFSKYESLLKELETCSISTKQQNALLKYMEDYHVYGPIFNSYISRRISENIHPERLLQIAYNAESHKDTVCLSQAVNARVADSLMLKEQGFDQFYFMNRHDTRTENHVFDAVIDKIGGRLDDNTFSIVSKIATHCNLNTHSLMLKALGSGEFSAFRTMMFMDKLPVDDQYLLVVKALEEDNAIALSLLRPANGKLYRQVSKDVEDNGDNSQYATALRNTQIPIIELENNSFIYDLVDEKGSHIPDTLGQLYIRAEQESRWDFFMKVCEHKNKKEVLRVLCNVQDKSLIDRFFAIYKHHPDVKHLTPFL